jgi:RNA polymerase sigma factor for flagellar operon FliA
MLNHGMTEAEVGLETLAFEVDDKPEPDDEQIRKQRILSHLSLVHKEAHRVARRLPDCVDVDDLISAGYLGLLSAGDRFEPSRGLSFGAFAYHRVRGAILDELRALDPISRHKRQRCRQVEQLRHDMTCELGLPPSSEALAERLGMSIVDFECEQSELSIGLPLSFDSLSPGLVALRLTDEDEQSHPERAVLEKELLSRLVCAIQRLPDRERAVISLYYHGQLPYREIAGMFGVTESRICQVHRSAVERIRGFFELQDRRPAHTLH